MVTSPIQQLHGGHHHSIATSLSKVAAAVVCATVGKRRPSVTPITFSELESGLPKESGHECHLPPLPPVPGQHSQRPPMTTQGLDQTELKQHVKTMKSEKTRDEMAMYADRLYFTVLNKDVALDLSTNQISVLQKELDQTRAQAEESKNALTDEVDRVKGQVATMEENFLLWRTKVQNDQMAQQEDYLSKRLLKQNRIEELEDELITSQEEVKRLRTRLLALEYEDGYVGPTSFLPASSDNYNPNNNSNVPSRPLANNKYRDSSVTIEMEPMTVTSHKRRSNDFHIMELKAQTFESQVQELMKVLELERQDRHKDFSELKMRMHAQCSKLEHEVQAAKMESTMYNEMMHEVVTENDDLRKQIKHLQRNSKHQSIHRSNNHGSNDTNNSNNESGTKQGIYNTGMNSSTSSADNSSSSSIGTLGYNNRGNDWYRRRQDDYYGYPSSEFDGAGYDSLYESEDEMEEIAF
ncbi:hypothetical protein BGZ83_010496 [Gryganskiella cystojenkinii]|nr:hypothetical protein BGZ83_010496 [Gryganskiella cystojenkinii]